MWPERAGDQRQERLDHVRRCRDDEREAWQVLQAIGEQLAERAEHPEAREALRADYERAYRVWRQARYSLDLALVPPPGAMPAPCLPLCDQPREVG